MLTNKQQKDFLSALNAICQKIKFANIQDVTQEGNHPNEDLFHSILNLIIIQSLKIYKFGTEIVSKNIESGRADIVFITNDGIGGIIEVKYLKIKKCTEKQKIQDELKQKVQEALNQIEYKQYGDIFIKYIEEKLLHGILKIGVAFSMNIQQYTDDTTNKPTVDMQCEYCVINNSNHNEMICDNTSDSQLMGCNNEAESII